MGRLLLTFVLAGFFIAWIAFLFRKVFLTKPQIAAARARFARTLSRLQNLKEEFYITEKAEYFLREDVRLAEEEYQGNPIVQYEYLIGEIEKILYYPDGYLKRKTYDPVSGSPLQEEETVDRARQQRPQSDDDVIIMKPDDRGVYSKIGPNRDGMDRT